MHHWHRTNIRLGANTCGQSYVKHDDSPKCPTQAGSWGPTAFQPRSDAERRLGLGNAWRSSPALQ